MTDKSTLISEIEHALDSIRPFLIEDGGNVELIDVSDDMVVKVELKGACKSCSMNKMTFKSGVENAIISAVPQIVRVESVNAVTT